MTAVQVSRRSRQAHDLRGTALACFALAGVLCALALASSMAGLSPARAATVGVLKVNPSTGLDITPIDVMTPTGCPRPATNVIAKIFGSGFPAYGQNVVGNTSAGLSNDSSFSMPLGDTLRTFAQLQPGFTSFSGAYRLVLMCTDVTGFHSYGDFVGTIAFTSTTAWAATGASAGAAPSAAAGTSSAPVPTAAAPSASSSSSAATAIGGSSASKASGLAVASPSAAHTAEAVAGKSGRRTSPVLYVVAASVIGILVALVGRTYARRRG
jgi:hypothetical protein